MCLVLGSSGRSIRVDNDQLCLKLCDLVATSHRSDCLNGSYIIKIVEAIRHTFFHTAMCFARANADTLISINTNFKVLSMMRSSPRP